MVVDNGPATFYCNFDILRMPKTFDNFDHFFGYSMPFMVVSDALIGMIGFYKNYYTWFKKENGCIKI